MSSTIKTERFPNPHILDFHFRVEISRSHAEDFFRPIRESSNEPLGRVGEFGRNIVVSILELPGVTSVGITPYQLRVEKARLFDWREIEPKVLEILTQALQGVEADTVELIQPSTPTLEEPTSDAGEEVLQEPKGGSPEEPNVPDTLGDPSE